MFLLILEMMLISMTTVPLKSVGQTAKKMEQFVRQYYSDLGDKLAWPFIRYFCFVRDLPYRPDPPRNERVSRPGFTIDPAWPDSRDCDDKAVLIGSYLYARKIPFRFVASSELQSGMLHHVFVVAETRKIGRICIDATYRNNRLGEWPRGNVRKNLSGVIING
jgi:hypothetical protein